MGLAETFPSLPVSGLFIPDVPGFQVSFLTRFKKIAIQATAQMAADKEAFGLSRVDMYESKCILPLKIIVHSVLEHINTTRMQTIS